MTIHIRNAAPADAETIVAFNAAMAQETEDRHLDRELLGCGVDTVLGDRSKGRYWLAEIDGAVAGQLMITYEWSDWRNGTLWWIQSVYVPERFRRSGVFTALYRYLETLANDDPDCCGIRLYVERRNKRAQATYEALGMKKPGYEVMEVDYRRQRESVEGHS